MAELKTQENDASVEDFINGVEDPKRREDCRVLLVMMQEVCGVPPRMWGPSMVGFGRYHYRYESGREGDSFRVGFSPRKQDLTVYISGGFASYETQLARLGKHKLGKSCLYLKRLSDIDLAVLREMLASGFRTKLSVEPD